MTTPVLEQKPAPKEAVVREVPAYQDVFRPVLLNSPSLHHTDEQDFYIKKILEKCCSDSQFAKKAYEAIKFVMSQEEPPPEVLAATRVVGEYPLAVREEYVPNSIDKVRVERHPDGSVSTYPVTNKPEHVLTPSPTPATPAYTTPASKPFTTPAVTDKK